ncbi:hypothetical protein P153DRAFT_371168 [Dothidotthia symphoricarpi CBS 119687]|uniref:Protein kinase domain-containing protein n=1 Tax=Dothidotthia symphoricarpi CBS 119687 TaxID=1392245 RepID=A0A6A6A033_9PLEO|nr:uncharacterized protein P153DRAFT_371168 [Dothidotthia symphoricarpi CBS 119687]KAF2124317.1 hypothetical protein P153DRAFT_371168 [Dothidotthia symphoricarpi CBS 119687]
METISRLPRRLTQLYSDTKTSCDAVVEQDTRDTQPESSALHRKFRIQKDRYIAWGVDWSDNSKGKHGDIDESVEQAGLTETVASVLGTIKEILDEAEIMHPAVVPAPGKTLSEEKRRLAASDPPSWAAGDRSRYEDLIQDLTTSIDILYDLSRTRRMQRANERGHISSKSVPEPPRPSTSTPVFLSTAYSASDLTLVNPATFPLNPHVPNVASHPHLPPKLNPADLILPEEEPPPYESVGSSSIRVIGQLRLRRTSTNPWKTDGNRVVDTPVLVEYATYDPTYRFNKVLPPTNRLDNLLAILTKLSNDQPFQGTLKCLGYFEDPREPRFGIVFELPSSTYSEADVHKSAEELRPVTLLSVLQTGSKSLHSSNSATPPLEDRFRLAFTLGLTFSKIHGDNFVHKDLNSSNILVFRKNKRQSANSRALQYALRAPVVCSFDLFSEHDIEVRSTMPTLNIYRHPEDPKCTGDKARPYGPQFDLYSLGLILLEVGLWQPLADLWKPKYTLSDFKQRVEEVYIRRLASKCGTAYMHVVRDCFWAADRIQSGAEGVQDLAQLYNRILIRLQRCCMLDESETGPEATEHRPGPTPVTSAAPLKRKSVSQPHIADLSSSPSYRSAKRWALEKGSQALERTKSLSKKSPDPSTLSRHPSRGSQNYIRKSISESLRLMSPKEEHSAPIDWAHAREPLEDSGGTLIAAPSNSQDQSDTSSIYREKVVTAASVIQRAWRASRAESSREDSCHALTLKDYKQKITVIQKAWRQSKQKRTNTIEALFTDGIRHWPQAVLGYPTPEPEVHPVETVEQTNRSITSSIQIQTDMDQAPRPKLRLFPVKFAPAIVDEWHATMLPRLERLIERALKDSDETISIDLVAVGETQEKARPTIFVTCSSVAKIKAILNRRFRYDENVFDLKVRRGKIRRSKASRSSRQTRPPHRSMMNTDTYSGDMAVMNPWHQQRPLCGASIGAFCREKHLPPVSYGGVILVDDEPLGMSVHHMLDAPSDDESESDDEIASSHANNVMLSSATGRNDSYLMSMGVQPGVDLDSDSPWSMDLELSDDEDTSEAEFYSDDDSDSEAMADSTTSQDTRGDLPGIGLEEGEEIKITQPALDDVEDDFFPNEEDRDEDHLDSHELGHVYASSGIRRMERDGNKHEIDWALLKLNENRLQPYNLVQGGRRFCFKPMGLDQHMISAKLEAPINRRHYAPEEDEYPNGIASQESLGGMNVHCFGRTTGLQGGMIGHAMSAVRIYKRKTFSKSWQVFGGFGMGGDSGAWVVQNGTHAVVGHVLAWCARNHIAYICPMEVLLEDIKRTLGAKRIYLPGSAEQLSHVSKHSKHGIKARGEQDVQDLEMRVQGLGLGIDSAVDLRSAQGVRAGFGRRSRMEIPPLITSGESERDGRRMMRVPLIKTPEAKVGVAAVP